MLFLTWTQMFKKLLLRCGFLLLMVTAALFEKTLLESKILVDFPAYRYPAQVSITGITIFFRTPASVSVPANAVFVLACNQLTILNPVVVISSSAIIGSLSAIAEPNVLKFFRSSGQIIAGNTNVTLTTQLQGNLVLDYGLCNSSLAILDDSTVIALSTGVCISLPDIAPIWIAADPTSIPQAGNGLVHILGVGFQPAWTFFCVFSLQSTDSVTPAYYQSLTSLICYSPRCESPGQATVRVRLAPSTGSNRTTSADLLRSDGSVQEAVLVTPAAWITLLPTGISALGGTLTVVGTGFVPTARYTVAFDATFTSPTGPCNFSSPSALLCVCPPQVAEGVSLLRIADGGTPVAKIGGPMTLRFLSEWSSYLGPRAGGVNGGDAITLLGAGFVVPGGASFPQARYYCRWEGPAPSNFTAAVVLDSARVSCITPAWGGLEYTAAVALYSRPDGDPAPLSQDDLSLFTGALGAAAFDIVAAWRMPALISAPAAGGLPLTVGGVGFHPNHTYACRLVCAEAFCLSTSVDSAPAVPLNSGTLACTTPPWTLFPNPPRAATLQSSFAVFRTGGAGANAVGQALLTPLDPGPQLRFVITRASWAPGGQTWAGPWRGGVLLTLLGAGFCYAGGGASGCGRNAYRCRFEAGNRTAEAGQCLGGADAGITCLSGGDCTLGTCSSVLTAGTAASRILNDSALACAVPVWPYGEGAARIAVYDVTFATMVPVGEEGSPARYLFTAAFVDATAPAAVPVSTATIITIHGSFVPAGSYWCRFGLNGAVRSAVATWVSTSQLTCMSPAWGPFMSEGEASPFAVYTADNFTLPAVQPIGLRFYAQWDGLGQCPGGARARWPSATAGSACGQYRISVRGWGLAPLPVTYQLRFQDSQGNVLLAEVANVTNSTDPRLADSPCQGGVYVIMSPWLFPAIATSVTLEYGGVASPSTIVPLMWGQHSISYEMLQVVTAVSAVSTAVLCKPPCWPVSVSIAGCGLISGPAVPVNIGGYVLQSHTYWSCRLSGQNDGLQISSYLATVQGSDLLVCVLNPVNPNYTVQAYRVSVLFKGASVAWSNSSKQFAELQEVWTRIDCGGTFCDFPSSGGVSFSIHGFAFSTTYEYECVFSRGEEVAAVVNATLKTQNQLICISPEWDFPEGLANISVLRKQGNRHINEEVPFAAIASFTRTVSFHAVWWCSEVQSAPVVRDAAQPAILTVFGRGFDIADSVYAVVLDGNSSNGKLSVMSATTNSINSSQINFEVPEFSGFEGLVSVQVLKLDKSGTSRVAIVKGGSIAHPKESVVSSFLYLAVIYEVYVELLHNVLNSFRCFPEGKSQCWGVSGTLLCFSAVTSIFYVAHILKMSLLCRRIDKNHWFRLQDKL